MATRRTGFVRTWIVCLLACGFMPVVYALPIVQTAACINDVTQTCATGVAGVEVSGTVYDVVFNQASYDVLFALDPPTFLNDDAGGIAAVDALIPLLNAAGIRGLFGIPVDPVVQSFLFVPVGVIAPLGLLRAAAYSSGADFSPAASVNFTSDELALHNPGRFSAYAVFTPIRVDVPAPPVMALLVPGLVCMGLFRGKGLLPA